MAIRATAQTEVIDITDSYSVTLSNENHTFAGTETSVNGTQTITSEVQAIQGGNIVACKVGTISTPTGISIVSDGKSPKPTLTITATSALKSSGSITIPVIIDDITINKVFSYSIAFKGTSVEVKSTAITYQAGTSGTAVPTGSWQSLVPTVPLGSYLWTKTVVTYSDGNSTTSYSVSRQPKDGTNGVDGMDAITMAITSSNGTIFKNTAIATVLTAHIYQGGAEVTGSALTALGTIKWYKDGGTTAVATGSTFTITAGDVSNKAVFSAQLEG